MGSEILRCGLKFTTPRLVYASLVASERKLRMTTQRCYPERSEGSLADFWVIIRFLLPRQREPFSSGNVLHAGSILLEKGGDQKRITIRSIGGDDHFMIGTRIDKGQGGRSAHAFTPPSLARGSKSPPGKKTQNILSHTRNLLIHMCVLSGAIRGRSTTGRDMANVDQWHIDNFIPLLFHKSFGSDDYQVFICLPQATRIN